MLEPLIGLFGVLLGFGLGAGYQECMEWRNRKKYKSAIRAELKANLHSIPQKVDTIQNMLAALNRGELLPGPAVRFSRSSYDQYFPFIAAHLTEMERNSLHLLYEYFRVTDDLIVSSSESIAQTLGTDQVEVQVNLAKAKLGDLPNLLSLTEELLVEHIKGRPRDVYHTSEDYDDLRQSRFTRDRRYT